MENKQYIKNNLVDKAWDECIEANNSISSISSILNTLSKHKLLISILILLPPLLSYILKLTYIQLIIMYIICTVCSLLFSYHFMRITILAGMALKKIIKVTGNKREKTKILFIYFGVIIIPVLFCTLLCSYSYYMIFEEIIITEVFFTVMFIIYSFILSGAITISKFLLFTISTYYFKKHYIYPESCIITSEFQ